MTILENLEKKVDHWKGLPSDEIKTLDKGPDHRARLRRHLEPILLANIIENYHRQRLAMGLVAIAFPLVLYLFGYFPFKVHWQPSISDYYYALPLDIKLLSCTVAAADCERPLLAARDATFPLRSVFCGGLVAVGVYLWVFKGLNWIEDWLMNIAGAFAIGVALFPMGKPPFESIFQKGLHFGCAIGLFVCMGLICAFCAKDTLAFLHDEAEIERYRTCYRRFACGMFVVVLLGGVYYLAQGPLDGLFANTLFMIEALGIWIFGAYWLVKSREIARHKFGRAP